MKNTVTTVFLSMESYWCRIYPLNDNQQLTLWQHTFYRGGKERIFRIDRNRDVSFYFGGFPAHTVVVIVNNLVLMEQRSNNRVIESKVGMVVAMWCVWCDA